MPTRFATTNAKYGCPASGASKPVWKPCTRKLKMMTATIVASPPTARNRYASVRTRRHRFDMGRRLRGPQCRPAHDLDAEVRTAQRHRRADPEHDVHLSSAGGLEPTEVEDVGVPDLVQQVGDHGLGLRVVTGHEHRRLPAEPAGVDHHG